MIHRCKDGATHKISEMEDSHLVNTIHFFIKKLAHAKEIMSRKDINSDFMDCYRKEAPSYEAAEDYVSDFNEKISQYILEANIRGLDIELSMEMLRGIIERSEKEVALLQLEEEF